jgi:hypothetical protein
MCACHQFWLPRFKVPGLIDTQDETRGPQAWCDILTHYSGRSISFHHDRLPAISSLAATFKNSSGRYLAGLFESDLPMCLIWWTEGGHRSDLLAHEKSSPPSWSWASVEGGTIYYGTGLTEPLAIPILDVAANDPKGLVLGGHLILRAPLLPMKSSWRRHRDEDMYHQYNLKLYPTWLPDIEDGVDDDEENPQYCHGSLDDVAVLRPIPDSGAFETRVLCWFSRLTLMMCQRNGPQRCTRGCYSGHFQHSATNNKR